MLLRSIFNHQCLPMPSRGISLLVNWQRFLWIGTSFGSSHVWMSVDSLFSGILTCSGVQLWLRTPGSKTQITVLLHPHSREARGCVIIISFSESGCLKGNNSFVLLNTFNAYFCIFPHHWNGNECFEWNSKSNLNPWGVTWRRHLHPC